MRKFLTLIFLLAGLLPGFASPASPQPAAPAQETCRAPFRPVATPLTDMGDAVYTRMDGQVTEFIGGLYPGGVNTPPPQHEAAGLALAAQIAPLNPAGDPDPANGKIGFISVGMSNTSIEFGAFMQLFYERSDVNPALALVNGAIANQTAERWVDPAARAWTELERQLNRQGLSPEQVQVAWVKQTLTRGGDFPAKALALQADLEAIARNLRLKYPNLKLAFFSSRTRSYAINRGLSPEPTAFETGFAVRWMIEKQIAGDPALSGEAAPFLAWGPYLWIDGTNPRLDGRTWLPEDLASDCTHPSAQGARKVAEMLFEFFSSDTLTRGWFMKPDDAAPHAAAVTATQAAAPAAAAVTATQAAAPPATAAVVAAPTQAAAAVGTTAADPTAVAAQLTPPVTPGAAVALPARRLAPLGLAFVILLFLLGALGVWLWLRRVRR